MVNHLESIKDFPVQLWSTWVKRFVLENDLNLDKNWPVNGLFWHDLLNWKIQAFQQTLPINQVDIRNLHIWIDLKQLT